MHKANKICLSQHILDPLALKQRIDQIFFLLLSKRRNMCTITVQMNE